MEDKKYIARKEYKDSKQNGGGARAANAIL